ncbi:MAG TPA: type ISP restriction/modification enzyme [Pyrinomonadaceae bacterium]|nr:type ISP restriction/modification enzyme [Pyrinomonadaceae bacterium]
MTNNKFIYGEATDGIRKHLESDFDEIYLMDLGGDVVMNPKLSGTTHNVFGIKLGVSINIFVRKKKREKKSPARIFYARLGEFWLKEEKYRYLDQALNIAGVEWKEVEPNAKQDWLTEGIEGDFDDFIAIGSKCKTTTGEVIFRAYSRGVATSRDSWAYNFERSRLEANMGKTIGAYNEHVLKWKQLASKSKSVDNFVTYDDLQLSWSRDLKLDLKRSRLADFKPEKIRAAHYRPFTKTHLFFDRVMNEEVYVFPLIFPIPATEKVNRVICATGVGAQQPFASLIASSLTDLNCFGSGTVVERGPESRRLSAVCGGKAALECGDLSPLSYVIGFCSLGGRSRPMKAVTSYRTP